MKALLVIDVQKGYIERYESALLSRINRRIEKAAAENTLIIYVKNVRKLKSGNTVNEHAEGLFVCSDNIVYKERSSVFEEPAFAEMLGEHGVSEIEIIGIDGCCCVAKTAEDAAKSGYKVNLPLCCIGVKNAERFEKKKAVLKKLGVSTEE